MSTSTERKQYTREEVAQHSSLEDQWIVIDNKVYNISNFAKKHPGGSVISFYRGQDATDAARAFHPDWTKMEKYMKPLLVGELTTKSVAELSPLLADFRKLREKYEAAGLFKASVTFYTFQIVQVILLELFAIYAAATLEGWSRLIICSILLATAQIQAGWNQHDYGHLSVFFGNRKWNTIFHHITIGVFKGASSHWWKTRHNRHHAKTNVIEYDPDIKTEPIFFWNAQWKNKLANKNIVKYQHLYWWLIGPPVVTTVLFVYQNMYHMFKAKKWVDLACTLAYFFKFVLIYGRIMNGWEALAIYVGMRLIESHWFTWVTSMSHLPKSMKFPSKNSVDSNNWVYLNVDGTQNIATGAFHDWFTGHLNYQIEHHLFPLMPRHNYPKVAAEVKALCEQHGLPYQVKSMYQCCADIVNKLQDVAATGAE